MYPSSLRQDLTDVVMAGGDVVDVLARATLLAGDRPVSSLLFALRDIFKISPLQMNAVYAWHGFGGGLTDDEIRRLVPLEVPSPVADSGNDSS